MTDLKSSSTVVEHQTHEPKFAGSNPATAGSRSNKIVKIDFDAIREDERRRSIVAKLAE
jgi:hypothetical protein